MIDTEILHFGHLGAEKIEFEVGRSNFKNVEKWQLSNCFYDGYFNFEIPFTFQIFFPLVRWCFGQEIL